jgi:hypothetical protein
MPDEISKMSANKHDLAIFMIAMERVVWSTENLPCQVLPIDGCATCADHGYVRMMPGWRAGRYCNINSPFCMC